MRSSAADPTARLLDAVRTALVKARLVPRGATCVVAVSGGADSTSLLDALARLRPSWGGGVRALHVDHGVRADSARDADAVRRLAEDLGVACDVVTVDGLAFAREHRLGTEHAGRILRYRALAEAVACHKPAVAATGHTRDDSVESVLLHLLRGTGLDGLRGIRARERLDAGRLGPTAATDESSLTVVRPLLGLARFDTAAYCTARGLAWSVDPTNDDTRMLRNRIRHQLLPLLRTYNPAIDAAIERTAAVLDEDAAWLDALAERRWRLAATTDEAAVQLRIGAARHGPRAARRRLVRRALSALGDGMDTVGFETVERALAVAAPNGPRRMDLGGRLSAERTPEALVLRRGGDEA